MAEQERGLSRALSAPARAVSRILAPAPAVTARPALPEHGTGLVDFALYVDGVRQDGEWTYQSAYASARSTKHAFVWIGLHEPTPEEFSGIAEAFNLHELAVEDAVKAFQRPKLEQYEDMTFAVVRTARYMPHAQLTETSEVIETGSVMLFIGEHYVITVRHGAACRLRPVREELERRHELLAQGPWAVFHGVVDRIVDIYLDVAAAVEDDLEMLEASVFSRERRSNIQEIYQLKRELVEFKRAVMPLQRPLQLLVSGQIGGVPKEPRRYIRDVNDHLQRVIEQLLSYDDLLNSVLQARLAQVTVDQNNDMRKIASWAAIAAVPTALAGIYGMNFKFMPELEWRYGYPMVLTLIIVICGSLYRFLRRSGWL
ncbi:magnesium/cobalt transporter CorA [Longispora albida]|uniref:magnesium/cobalt transporter CorA n=1 Tax=Longispora albida TaxID=203523 RepID=UPI00035CA872|nr:magnesium/cobalt transporter CorA [Longispora albida]